MEEPWLRGPITGVHPQIGPVLYAFQHAREDLARFTEDLTMDQLWAEPFGLSSVGFHILHIARSVDRLISYTQGRQLSPEQMEQLGKESSRVLVTREELLARMERSF